MHDQPTHMQTPKSILSFDCIPLSTREHKVNKYNHKNIHLPQVEGSRSGSTWVPCEEACRPPTQFSTSGTGRVGFRMNTHSRHAVRCAWRQNLSSVDSRNCDVTGLYVFTRWFKRVSQSLGRIVWFGKLATLAWICSCLWTADWRNLSVSSPWYWNEIDHVVEMSTVSCKSSG